MKYIKYNMGSYNLHTIKTDKFKTISIRIDFQRKIVKEEIIYANLISAILFESSKNYIDKRNLTMAMEDLYYFRMSTNVYNSGNYRILSVLGRFLNEKYTEEDMTEKTISFLIDLILNPDISNNEFKESKLKIVRKGVKEVIESIKDKPNSYSMLRLLEEMDPQAPYAYCERGYLEDLEKVTIKNLYEYYQSMMKSDLIDIYIIGDIDSNKIKKTFSEKFSINTLKKKKSSYFIDHEKTRKTTKIKFEKYNCLQSKLKIGFKVDSLSDFDRKYVGYIYNYILGGGPNSKLFINVREKNSLCYNISSNYRPVSNLLIISSGINKKDYKKAVSLIKKEIANMSKGIFEESDIESAKKIYINSLKQMLDSPFAIINSYVGMEQISHDDINKRMNEIHKVTKEMVINFAKKIHLDTIFLLEGSSNEEEKTE